MKTVFIKEGVERTHLEILKESKQERNPRTVKFRAVLQTADSINNNGRLYPQDVLREGLDGVKNRINSKAFIGELDHPEQGEQSIPHLKNASHVITKVWFEGNKVCGEGETLSTPSGEIAKNLLLDGIPIGFSLRGLGNLQEKRVDGKLVNVVSSPLLIISYDMVGNPSHTEAIVKEVSESTQFPICKDGLCESDIAMIERFLLESQIKNILLGGIYNSETEDWW
ncbi:MAG: hypothetical protein QXV17_14285 [Candidatus Micrarchaeaceae archaeon]